jgi:hypothetical protein
MFLSDTARDPTAIEQISTMIERYNQLIIDIKSIEDLQKRKDYEIEQLKMVADTELAILRNQISEIQLLVDKATRFKTVIGKEFKRVIKVDSFNRLSKRVDNLNFENRLPRQEFYHLLER